MKILLVSLRFKMKHEGRTQRTAILESTGKGRWEFHLVRVLLSPALKLPICPGELLGFHVVTFFF